MREIKFRAWLTNENKMYDFDLNDSMGDHFNRLDYGYGKYELLQYTGLLDKNGKEIYEGDIIRTVKPGECVPNRDSGGGIIDYDFIEPEERTCYVEFFAATFATKEVKSKANDNFYAPLDWIIHDEQVEVIGNIYENPELMES